MIQCELCEEHFEEEDIKECPECLKIMCEECYEEHIPICFYVSQYEEVDDFN